MVHDVILLGPEAPSAITEDYKIEHTGAADDSDSSSCLCIPAKGVGGDSLAPGAHGAN